MVVGGVLVAVGKPAGNDIQQGVGKTIEKCVINIVSQMVVAVVSFGEEEPAVAHELRAP
jgi:hypothetical protein